MFAVTGWEGLMNDRSKLHYGMRMIWTFYYSVTDSEKSANFLVSAAQILTTIFFVLVQHSGDAVN